MEIGVRIRALRKARGMKQEDFAEALGVSVQTVSRWENGTNAPDIAMLPLLCACFHVTSDYLLGLERKDNMAKLLKTVETFGLRSREDAKELVRLTDEKGVKFLFCDRFVINTDNIVTDAIHRFLAINRHIHRVLAHIYRFLAINRHIRRILAHIYRFLATKRRIHRLFVTNTVHRLGGREHILIVANLKNAFVDIDGNAAALSLVGNAFSIEIVVSVLVFLVVSALVEVAVIPLHLVGLQIGVNVLHVLTLVCCTDATL